VRGAALWHHAFMLSSFADRFRPLALTLFRLGLGIVFLYHGSVKLSHLGQWTHNFVHMGFPPYFAYIAGTLEALGGALLILGLFTRVVALLLAGELLIALVRVHLPHTPLLQVGGYELPLLLSGGAFLVFAYGAGPVALDRLWFGGGAGRMRRGRG
jgi:putative oxidoreductase